MTTDIFQKTIDQLDNFTPEEMLSWVRQAIQREMESEDERDYQPLQSMGGTQNKLNDQARINLRTACLILAEEFCRDQKATVDYTRSLLSLVCELKLEEAAPLLVSAAQDYPNRPDQQPAVQNTMLGALLDLHVPQPTEFWEQAMSLGDGKFIVRPFSGILKNDPTKALSILPQLPERESMADGICMTLSSHTNKLGQGERELFLGQLKIEASKCKPILMRALKNIISRTRKY